MFSTPPELMATIALRAEAGLEALFPGPAAAGLDELLKQQAAAGSMIRRARPRKL